MSGALITGGKDSDTHGGPRNKTPPTRQEARPREKPALLMLDLGLPAFRTKRK